MLVLTNARLIDGTGSNPKEGVTVIIDGERIASVREGQNSPQREDTAGTKVIDLNGRTLLPGLINAHMHIMMDAGPDPIATLGRSTLAAVMLEGARRGERMLRAGITTARDLGGFKYGELALRDAFARGDFPGPRLLCAGKLITMTGGHGWTIGLEVDGADEARKAARENLMRGVDCLKLMATGGVLTPGVEPGAAQLTEEEMRAAIDEAHKVGKHTASHAQGTEGIKNAIRAGIDTIEHGIFLDDEAIEMMVERGVALVATLAAPYRIVEAGERAGIPKYAVEKSLRVLDAHRQSFEWAVQAGVTVAAGNDGGTPFNPSEDLVTEIRLMSEAGLGNMGAIRAATHGSARAVGLSEETGTLQVGKYADCIVLADGADPLADITSLGRIDRVIQRGKMVASP
ncbi:MAG: amidohydrolase family protein [Chloroflexi bacterium]|nr:amidohydrolase family protein [Chloroflexota bacterium]